MNTFGIDLDRIKHLRNVKRYILEVLRYKKLGGEINRLYPILSNYSENAGSASGPYFHHDLLVAQFVYETKPRNHLDVGSRIDGFVAHVASFRPIVVADVRELEPGVHSNIRFVAHDFSKKSNLEKFDSISCLNALEHFGLGRYGDELNPEGSIDGLRNIIDLLEPRGILYLAVPVGFKNSTEFNAGRIFEPNFIPTCFQSELVLMRLDYINGMGSLQKNVNLQDLANLKNEIGCLVYTFKKIETVQD